MGKNRQETGDTGTDAQGDADDGTELIRQQDQPSPSGSLEEPVADGAVNNPNIINR